MILIKNPLIVPNHLARDSEVKGVLEEINGKLIKDFNSKNSNSKPFLVCSGGTSSRCAANGYWTLDLRKNYREIIYDNSNQTVEVGAGVNMSSLIQELSRKGKTFPIGLSGQTGIGYILTGGISPISRSKGLAIDQIINIKGYWGNGDKIDISKPNSNSSIRDIEKWRGLCGAAPFLAIITSIKLNIYTPKPLYIYQAIINPDQLAESIYKVESWPNSASFQWVWGERIKAFVVIEESDIKTNSHQELINELPFKNEATLSIINGLHELPRFDIPLKSKRSIKNYHSEVLSLLGKEWGKDTTSLIKSISKLIKSKPNQHCYVASQQMGGACSSIDRNESSFIHRNAAWKPWINSAWEKGNSNEREQSFLWLEEVWQTMEKYCPGVHLAQLHPHLPWHQKELKSAFLDWLPGLQTLKSRYDPQGLLPPL